MAGKQTSKRKPPQGTSETEETDEVVAGATPQTQEQAIAAARARRRKEMSAGLGRKLDDPRGPRNGLSMLEPKPKETEGG